MAFHFIPYLDIWLQNIVSWINTQFYFPRECCASHNVSIFNGCVRVHGGVFSPRLVTGGAAQWGPKQGRGTCQERGLPHPSKTSPSSSAAHQPCRSRAVNHTRLLHHYPLVFFSVQLACHSQFFSYSSQITYLALSLPLQMPLNVFIMTVKSLIAFNNISYEQILFTDLRALRAL